MRFHLRIVLLLAVHFAAAAAPDQITPGRRHFEQLCAGCHGADGAGGERARAIGSSENSRTESEAAIREVIAHGIPDAGMPAFSLPPETMSQLVAFVRSRVTPASETALTGDPKSGEAFFFGKGQCANCHAVFGRGGLEGPDLTEAGKHRTLAQIERSLSDPDARRVPGYAVLSVKLKNGRTIRGFARNESNFDLQLQAPGGKILLLKKDEIAELTREPKSSMPPLRASLEETRNLLAFLAAPTREPAPPITATPDSFGAGDWPTYHGLTTGNRHSPLKAINTGNVSRLAPQWMFPIPGSRNLEVTPVVVDGVMYVTGANEAFALDARDGREIWHYQRPRSKGLVGDASGGINRGVAVRGDRLFMVTDNAHLIALNRFTGGLIWDVTMADSRENYGATSAPLVVHDLVISGTSGGDEGVRGFFAAYKSSTGEEAWRFWTVPLPGEPLAKTWGGKAIEHGCATAWFTGAYDSETDTLFWNTGNPCPDYNGDERKGDNLYSDSTLALDPASGKLKWHFQYTPHDLHDWDAEQVPLLVDADFHGRPRKLLLQASRNGFFYVLDRTSGELLLATPFVKELTWSSGIGKDGRPQLLPGAEPTVEGVRACPAVEGATNWMSSAYSPGTKLFYVMALEKCSIYGKSSAWWQRGRSFYGGSTRDVPGERGKKFLRAIDIETGKIAWEYPQAGPARSWGGVLSTAGGVVFFGEDSGAFAAADAKTGKLLWHFQTNQLWKASPMTYLVDGKQYVAVAAGSNIIAFGL